MESHGRWVGFMRRKQDFSEFEKEMISMVEEGQEQGVLPKNEADMIQNILGMEGIQAHDIMTRRNQIYALPSSMTLDEAAEEMIRVNKTRFPVYREDLDDIIGTLHLRAAFVAARDPKNLQKTLEEIPDLLYEAHFIPETKGIGLLFKEMQSQKNHIVVVVDEYGQTSGILTMEDIMEEIVGTILDESDEEEKLIERRKDGSFLVSGVARLEDVGKALDLDFEEGDFDTLNGFLISRLDRIPQPEENPRVVFGDYVFQVRCVKDNLIQKVHIFKDPLQADVLARGDEKR